LKARASKDRRWPALLALPLTLAACEWETEETRYDQHVTLERGIVLISRTDRVRNRFRVPMDHGGASFPIASRFHARAFDGDRFAMTPLTVSYRWDSSASDPEASSADEFPSFVRRGSALVRPDCEMVGPGLGPPCPGARSDMLGVTQNGARGERIRRMGDRLIFVDGLDGKRAPCAVDLTPFRRESKSAVAAYLADKGSGASRLAITYLPGRLAYIVDRAGVGRPIYLAGCGTLRRIASLDALIAERSATAAPWGKASRPVTDIQDIVPDGDGTNPALLIDWARSGTLFDRRAILRAGRSPVTLLPLWENGGKAAPGGYDSLAPSAFWNADPGRILLAVRPLDGDRRHAIDILDVDSRKIASHPVDAW